MAFINKHRKWRDEIRAKFTAETGLDYTDPSFEVWLVENGYLVQQ